MRILCFLTIAIFSNACSNSSDTKTDEQIENLWTLQERELLIREVERSMNDVLAEINGLTADQWTFREDSNRWSIAEIVEHLELQDEMHYRELYLVSKAPQSDKYLVVTKGKDAQFLKYATDPTAGITSWNLEPQGRFCSKAEASRIYARTRTHLGEFVASSTVDFRRHFTFRDYVDDGNLFDASLWDVRDLHQLVLTNVAHTDRHLAQIRKVKSHADYPG